MYLISNEKGLTLIEVTITLAIVGIISVPIFKLQSSNLKLNIKSNQEMKVSDLAEEKIEELKHINIKNIQLGKETTTKDGFEIITSIELIDRRDITEKEKEEGIKSNELYKLRVVVKNKNELIKDLTTYRNSLERSD